MTIRTLILAVPLMVCGWLSVLVGVSLVSDESPAQLVLFPSATLEQKLPRDVAVIGLNAFSVTLTADRPGFARSLYEQGAWLVLPAGLPGCSGRPESAS